MESKHTPGPWGVSNDAMQGYVSEYIIYDYYDRHVGNVVARAFDHADAALIAAAPDMYEVLRALRDAKRESTQALRRAADRLLDAALAKAEGL